MRTRVCAFIAAALAGLVLAAPASAAADFENPANQWLPSSDGATWTYNWTNDRLAPNPTREKYTLAKRDGTAFTLNWSSLSEGNGPGTVTTLGTIDYNRTSAGLITTGWRTLPAPSRFPVLCATASECQNSIASTHHLLNWGTRSPVLAEPLVAGTRWSSVGGQQNDVSSANRYLGTENVTVPAFPFGVNAAKVRSDVTQAGALGDPFGSGVRTVWWVFGVGPVKMEFHHTSGEATRSELKSTNLEPKPAPSDASLFPLNRGDKQTFRWRNSKHMRRSSTQRFEVKEVVNNTARVDVKSLKGPIRVAGGYVFANRLDGLTNLQAFTRAASSAKLPALGPRKLPRKERRRFFTPYDLMSFGFNPVLSAFPEAGDSWGWRSNSRDFSVFGVVGQSRVVGMRTVKVKAGRFKALVVDSKLRQAGFRFGTGTRRSYFAPGKGLVKLRFRHADGSVSTVERIS